MVFGVGSEDHERKTRCLDIADAFEKPRRSRSLRKLPSLMHTPRSTDCTNREYKSYPPAALGVLQPAVTPTVSPTDQESLHPCWLAPTSWRPFQGVVRGSPWDPSAALTLYPGPFVPAGRWCCKLNGSHDGPSTILTHGVRLDIIEQLSEPRNLVQKLLSSSETA